MKGHDAVAQVYAQALLDLAFEKGVPAEIVRDLEEIRRLLQQEPTLGAFLLTPRIRSTAKHDLIDRVFVGRVAEIVSNFLKVLIDKGRTAALPSAIDAFIALYHERQGEVVCTVTTPLALDAAERDTLMTALREGVRRRGLNDVILEERVDPALLGGLLLRSGDSLYDASLRTRLAAVGDRLRASRLKNEDIYED